MLQKIGSEAASSCRFLLHDPVRNTVKIGRTSLGTPVHVNREVLSADFVMGIGGVYPNNTAGFGGGSKLALGILDLRVISLLHRRHKSSGWGSEALECDFRRDLDEIAQMIRLETLITLHVNANREPVRMVSGDYSAYFPQEITFARDAFRAPRPDGADVVISNAFPNDLSLTFIHMKGVYPLRHAAPRASRIVLGSCSEGEGFHGVYPIVRSPMFHEQRDRLRRISLMSPSEIARKLMEKFARPFRGDSNGNVERRANGTRPASQGQPALQNPIWLYRTGSHRDTLPSMVRGIRVLDSWPEVLEAVRKEQQGRNHLKALVYPCAPLQVLE
jgi:nickel-dependent lactate racemase